MVFVSETSESTAVVTEWGKCGVASAGCYVTVSKDVGFTLPNGPHGGPKATCLGPVLFSTVLQSLK